MDDLLNCGGCWRAVVGKDNDRVTRVEIHLELTADAGAVAAMSCDAAGGAVADEESVPIVPAVKLGLACQDHPGVFGAEQLVRTEGDIEFQEVLGG